jgi:membrane peptidoglycan carboxypeptidase
MFLIVSVLAGVLIAGLFVPFAGMAGVSSRAAASELNSLPAELATPSPPTRSRVLMGNGKTLAYFYDENRIPVKLDQIAPVMRQAQIAIEDHRFYEHGALDFKGTLRALVRNQTSDATQGGSSITQQYVKMVQVEACQTKDDYKGCVADATAPNMERKIRELRYAIALEKRLSKDQILERYLNIAYYGQNAYGIEAAARHYYNTTAAKLTLTQSAMLAGLVQNPDSNNPVRNKSAALDRRDVVINRMAELKLITPGQLKSAKKVGFNEGQVKRTQNGCIGTQFPFLCDYVKETLLLSPSLGKTVGQRRDLLNRGGLTIETKIDPKMQKIAQRSVSKVVGSKDPLISTMDMVEPGSGLILAMAQSRPTMGYNVKKGETTYNYSVPYAMGGAEGYQAGSTFKAFTAAAALEKGIPVTKKYNARKQLDLSNVAFKGCQGSVRAPGYRPKNSTASGNMGMQRAMAQSVNTYFLQLEHTIGICAASKMADRLGVLKSIPRGTNLSNDPNLQVPSFTLGVAEIAPITMAEAYATFAARGVHCDPIIVSKITTRSGKGLDVPSANCKQVISKAVADGVTKLLTGVMNSGGTGSGIRIPGVRNQAGKTGTTEENKVVWFNGFTPEIAGVAMIAIDPSATKYWKHHRKSVKGFTVPSTRYYLQGHGSTDAGNWIWRPTMTQAMKGKPDRSFHQPPSRILHGKRVQVPSLYGMSLAAARRKLHKEGFSVEPLYIYSRAVRGSFVGWSPGPGATVAQYGTIYELRSKGKAPSKKKASAQARKKAAAAKKHKKKPPGPPGTR